MVGWLERFAVRVAADHVPVLIQPNTLFAGKYVVINGGHAFHEKELTSFNDPLFPRLGDWAVLKVRTQAPATSDALDEHVIRAGFFNEQWLLPWLPDRQHPRSA